MPTQHDLGTLTDLDWLVAARNEIQSLMLALHKHWTKLDVRKRQLAAGAVFSLWRAAFLLAEKEVEKPMVAADGKVVLRGRVDAAAKAFLLQVIRTNAITFGDDLKHAPWTAGYYINNAVYRVSEMQGTAGLHLGSSIRTMRTGWNEAFNDLAQFVSGTTTGTTVQMPEKSDAK